jgi:hypothetical protein
MKRRYIWTLIAIAYALLGWICEAQEAPAKHPVFTAYDWSIAAGQFAAHAMDYISTEHGLSQPIRYSNGLPYWWEEKELPASLVANKSAFAAYSFGMAGAEVFAQYELTKHGHRKLARIASEVSIGITAGTAANNWRTANKPLY